MPSHPKRLAAGRLQPTAAFFVGIDSDGCAFDTMEIKHKECFCPNTVKYWDLQAISKYAREPSNSSSLLQVARHQSLAALVMSFDLLRERPRCRQEGFTSRKPIGSRVHRVRDALEQRRPEGLPRRKS